MSKKISYDIYTKDSFKLEINQDYEDSPWHVVLFDKDGEHLDTFNYKKHNLILDLIIDIDGGIYG